MVCFATQYRTVLIFKDYSVIDVSGGVCCLECRISFTSSERLIPTVKGIGIGFVTCSCRISYCHYSFTIMVYNCFDFLSVVIRESNCVIDILGSVSCDIGRISHTINNFLIPTCEGVGIGIIRYFRRIGRNHNRCTVIIGIGADNRAVCIFKYHRVLYICRSELGRINCIALTGGNSFIPTDECIGVGFICRL